MSADVRPLEIFSFPCYKKKIYDYCATEMSADVRPLEIFPNLILLFLCGNISSRKTELYQMEGG